MNSETDIISTSNFDDVSTKMIFASFYNENAMSTCKTMIELVSKLCSFL